jgi:Transferrin receptor-like dimerisation domain
MKKRPIDQEFPIVLKSTAKLYDASKATTLSPQQQLVLDGLLSQIEQKMTQEAGLPRRPWFKHQIYAPGFSMEDLTCDPRSHRTTAMLRSANPDPYRCQHPRSSQRSNRQSNGSLGPCPMKTLT